jgi:hypothetical protein
VFGFLTSGGSAKPEVVAQNPALGERVGATPAIADNTLYIRTDGHLYAFAEKNEGGRAANAARPSC